jgi:hypothetical protein
LRKNGAEVGVDAVEVEVVHHAGRLHDPRIAVAGGVTPLLGPEHGRLLLRPADEHDPLGPAGRLEHGQLVVHHVVLALALDEIDPRDLVGGSERVHLLNEPVRDRPQRHG